MMRRNRQVYLRRIWHTQGYANTQVQIIKFSSNKLRLSFNCWKNNHLKKNPVTFSLICFWSDSKQTALSKMILWMTDTNFSNTFLIHGQLIPSSLHWTFCYQYSLFSFRLFNNGTDHIICQQRRFVWACASAQSRQSLCYSLTQYKKPAEASAGPLEHCAYAFEWLLNAQS